MGIHESTDSLKEAVLQSRFMRAALRRRNEVHIALARERSFSRPHHHPRGAFTRRKAFGIFISKA